MSISSIANNELGSSVRTKLNALIDIANNPLAVASGGTGTSTVFTTNSVVFAGASGVYSQDNAEFSWNDSTKALTTGGLSIGDTGLLADTTNTYDIGSSTNRFKDLHLAGSIGIGASPTARLHLAAGTAAASSAPLKLTSGTLQSSPETGALEYDGTNLSFVRSGSTRETVLVGTGDSDGNIVVNIEGTIYSIAATIIG